jgi:hypothetical protein
MPTTRAYQVARLLSGGIDGGLPDSTSSVDAGLASRLSTDVINTLDGGTP